MRLALVLTVLKSMEEGSAVRPEPNDATLNAGAVMPMLRVVEIEFRASAGEVVAAPTRTANTKSVSAVTVALEVSALTRSPVPAQADVRSALCASLVPESL